MRIIIVPLFTLLLLTGCVTATAPALNRTTNTESTQLSTDAEKIAFLDEYLVFHSAIQAAEFHIVYHDNSSGRVSGPSDWDIVATIKIVPADVSKWTAGRTPIDPVSVDLADWQNVWPTTEQWRVHSTPIAYQAGGGTVLVIYQAEGIVLFRSSTMG